jgi:threonine dehydratase
LQHARRVGTLAGATPRDIPVVAGESGAAGLAALQILAHSREGRRAGALDARSRVLLINTEGATAPAVYARLAGRGHEAVLEAQRAWQAARASRRPPPALADEQ